MEALDAEVPLIASAVGGLKDFLADEKNAILFEDNNMESLLNAYGKLAALRETVIQGGIATAEQYNWKTISAELTEIYRRML